MISQKLMLETFAGSCERPNIFEALRTASSWGHPSVMPLYGTICASGALEVSGWKTTPKHIPFRLFFRKVPVTRHNKIINSNMSTYRLCFTSAVRVDYTLPIDFLSASADRPRPLQTNRSPLCHRLSPSYTWLYITVETWSHK